MSDPDSIDLGEEPVKVTSLAVRLKDLDFLERYAAYRNELGKQRKTPANPKWSKKSMAEQLLAVKCDEKRGQLKDLFDAIGEFPPAGDEKAMTAYVKRMLSWEEKAK